MSRTGLAGLILWLPEKQERLPLHSNIPDGCYYHPVVILSPETSSSGEVVVLIVRVTCLSEQSDDVTSLRSASPAH